MRSIKDPISGIAGKLLDVCLFIIFLTASFDTLLNLKVGGFSVRICTILMALFSMIVFLQSVIVQRTFTFRSLGFWSFLIWFLLLLLFVPNSILLPRGIGYMLWLTIFFFFLLSMTVYIRSVSHLERILFLYIRSFTWIGVFGLLQFAGTVAGVEGLIEYYFQSGIPRIHGFSYEPSYFSTYLMIPWSFHFMLFFTPYETLKKSLNNRWSLLILTTVMLMSFSRMGIVLMILILFAKASSVIYRSLLRLKIEKNKLVFFTFFLAGTLIVLLTAILNIESFLSVFEGLPFFSKYAHSASIRLDDLRHTWMVFLRSPIWGYSLGGVAPAIAQLIGYQAISQEIVKHTEGMCVLLEILAASGIIGFVFFLLFLRRLLFSGRILKKLQPQNLPEEIVSFIKIHQLLILAFVFQLLLLCLNQNILRNYVWVHIALINVSFFVIKARFAKQETIHEP